LAQARGPGEGGVDLLGLVAVAAGEGDLERPSQLRVGEHGQKEGADELAVGKPDWLVRVEALDGEDIDEDGVDSLEEDVERRCVFEEPAVINEVAT
jgi:hypothetical protein